VAIQGCANGWAIFDNKIKATVRFKPALKYKYMYMIDYINVPYLRSYSISSSSDRLG